MSDNTGIEWTDATWNPVTGCTAVSAGCDHCYAKTFAERWRGVPGHYFQSGFDVTLRPDKLTLPWQWRKPRKVFVNSMSDLLHDAVPDAYIAKVFGVMALAGQHTFQVLTKRHARMRSLLTDPDRLAALDPAYLGHWIRDGIWPLPNVWLGVSVETQRWADIRIPALVDTPAAVRFLSCEPLLGPLDLAPWLECDHPSASGTGTPDLWQCDCCATQFQDVPDDIPGLSRTERVRPGIGWVVVGGESGPGARPMHPGWARDIRDTCQAADCRFLFKQWGMYSPRAPAQHSCWANQDANPWVARDGRVMPFGALTGTEPETDDLVNMHRVGKRAAGRTLDGRTWDEFPA